MYLYGPDAYRRSRALREKIFGPYLKKYPDGTIDRFDLSEEGEAARLKEFCGVQGLFAKVKLGIVTQVQEGEKECIQFLKTVLDDKATTLVIVAEKKLTKEFDFLLKEPVSSYEFNVPEGVQFISFLKKEAAELGLKISDTVALQVAEQFEGDSWGVITELQRLASGGAFEASANMPEFFPLVQTLKGTGPVSSRLKALWYVFETSDPAAVFNMLASLVSGSAKIKMADYDVAIKSGKLEYEEALLDFLLA